LKRCVFPCTRSLQKRLKKNNRRCVCDWAYNDGHYGFEPGSNAGHVKNKYCRENSISHFHGVAEVRRAHPGFCPSWGPHADLWFAESPFSVADGVLAWAAERAGPGGAVTLYSAGGLHTGLNAQSAASHVDAPYARMRALANGTRQVVALVHAPGRNHDDLAYASQNAAARRAYNAMLVERAAREGGGGTGRRVVFDAWTPTLNCTSFDGTHYEQAVNVVLAQLLLALLDAAAAETR
jgi:hypothetical protein